MNIKNTTFKGLKWSAIGKWGSQLINFIVLVIFARVLGPEAFGLIAMANIFVNIIYIFLDQGYSATIIQRKEINNELLNTAFWSNILVGFLFAFFGVIFSGVIARLYSEPELESIIRYLSLNFIILACGGIQQALLRRNFDFKLLAKSSIISTICGGSLGIGLALSGVGVWSLVFQILGCSIINVVILWFVSEWNPKIYFSWGYFLELSKFGINIVGNKALSFFDLQFDELLIGYTYGATQLGYYSIAKSIIIRLAGFFTGATTTVTMSLFSKMQDTKEQLLNAFYKVIEFTALVVFPLFFGIMLISSELITIIFGSQWGESIPILVILAPVGIVLSILHYHENITIAVGYPQYIFWMRFINTLLRVLLIGIAFKFGVNYIAIVVLLSSYILLSTSLIVVNKSIGGSLSKYFRSVVYPLISSTIMIVLGLVGKTFIRSTEISILSALFLIGLSSVIYFGVISIFDSKTITSLAKGLIKIIKREDENIFQN